MGTGLHSKRLGKGKGHQPGLETAGERWQWLLGQARRAGQNCQVSSWMSALWAPRPWPCPSHTGKGQVLPAPMEASCCAGLACGWPWLAQCLIPCGVGTLALGPVPDGVRHLDESSPGPAQLLCCYTSLLQPWRCPRLKLQVVGRDFRAGLGTTVPSGVV